MKNSYEADELNFLVVVNITNSSPIFKVLPVTIKKNFPIDTGMLKWRSRFLNVSPIPTHFQSLDDIKGFFRFGIYKRVYRRGRNKSGKVHVISDFGHVKFIREKANNAVFKCPSVA